MNGPDRLTSRLDVLQRSNWLRSLGALLLFGALPILVGGLTAAGTSPYVGLLVVVILAALVLAFLSPGLFLFVAIAVYSTTQDMLVNQNVLSGFAFPMNASQLFIITLTGVLLLVLGVASSGDMRRLPNTPPFYVHVGFLAWACCLTIASPEAKGWTTLARLACCLVIYAVGYWLGGNAAMSHYVPLSIAVTAVMTGITCAYDALAGGRVEEAIAIGAIRSGGSFGGPVSSATIAMVGAPIFLEWLVAPQRRWQRIASLLGFAAIGAAASFTLTRTAVVGLAVFVLLSSSAVLKNLSLRKRILLATIPSLLLVASFLFTPEKYLAARMTDLPGFAAEGGLPANYGSGRVLLWRGMMTLFRQSSPLEWVIGHGVDSVILELPRITGIYAGGHNSYIEILYQLGIVGSLLFGVMVLFDFKSLALRGDESQRLRVRIISWRAYYAAFLLSTIMFNGYIWSIGARWFTLLGLGWAAATLRARRD